MKDKDTMTRSKYPRKMDEVMDAMDSMWLFGANPYCTVGRCVLTRTFSLRIWRAIFNVLSYSI
jgi:hypothetical protein